MGPGRIHAEGAVVLVVDDDALVRWSLREALTGRGYVVREAADGREALRRAGDDVALAILDHRLPDTDGLALLDALRLRRPGLPVMLLTSFGTEELVAAALAHGALHVAFKPYDVEAVADRVDAALVGRT